MSLIKEIKGFIQVTTFQEEIFLPISIYCVLNQLKKVFQNFFIICINKATSTNKGIGEGKVEAKLMVCLITLTTL
jgi:hypothetical protein